LHVGAHLADRPCDVLRAAEARGVSGAFNLGSASAITINRLVELLREVSGIDPVVRYGPPRPGDVRDSLADVSAARAAFGYEPSVEIGAGLEEYVAWAQEEARQAAGLA
jgi:UDP-glucose 4-epimerase